MMTLLLTIQLKLCVESQRIWLGLGLLSFSKSSLFFLFSYHTAFKLYSLWHVGYLLDNFYDFHVCSRVKLQLFNPARRPALFQGATAFGLNALLLVLACGRNCWPSSPVLSIIPLSCSCYRLDASIGGGVLCLVHNISFWGLPAELGRSPRGWVS